MYTKGWAEIKAIDVALNNILTYNTTKICNGRILMLITTANSPRLTAWKHINRSWPWYYLAKIALGNLWSSTIIFHMVEIWSSTIIFHMVEIIRRRHQKKIIIRNTNHKVHKPTANLWDAIRDQVFSNQKEFIIEKKQSNFVLVTKLNPSIK